MSTTTLSKAKRKTTAEYEAEADHLLAEMHRLNKLMESDGVEIERLKAETQILREEFRRNREYSVRLQEESTRRQEKTNAALVRLKQAFD